MATASKKPTYGDLIDLFERFERNEDLLLFHFKKIYPEISIGRPKRFYETVLRIVAPTQPSALGKPKLCGSPLTSYRKRTWEPRIRTVQDACPTFPKSLHSYGLSEKLLSTVFHQVLDQREPLKWYLKGVGEVGFYRELHPFLKKWSVSCGSSKITIGRFYIAIDSNLKLRGMRADNVYRLIDGVSYSHCPSNTLMSYGIDTAVGEIRAMQKEATHCREQVETLNSEYRELRKEFEKSREELQLARKNLRDITNENLKLRKNCDVAERKAGKKSANLDTLKYEYALLEDAYADNAETIQALQNELSSVPDSSACNDSGDFTFITKCGRRYSPAVRKLYYSLLSAQVPSSRIAEIIKTVIRCFSPSIDVEQLRLPHRTCADYMRKDELKSVSNAHKATVLCSHASENQSFVLNTDGTTKFQRKIGGTAINNMVISVNELPDGTASSAIDDVSRELQKLRRTAHALGIPNADSINWTLVAVSSSDSAASQKRFNRLIEDYRERDEENFGPATVETIDLIESFCSMHLGINLRKAFLSGICSEDTDEDSSSRKYNPVNVIIHEFCKVFGKSGTPEYGCGVQAFPDFLAIMLNDSSLSEELHEYYCLCTEVSLHRQVGSRYFVSAANAVKIVFLREAAINFLNYTGKDTGNKLETDLYMKLLDCNEIARLRADSLMYFHVYADLVMLSKSNDLGKSVLDMNSHYLELNEYLEKLEKHPEIAMDKSYRVFKSESELYGTNKKVNHRCHKNCEAVHKKLFEVTEDDSSVLYPLLVSGAVKMKQKLTAYAQKQLPGGKYWEPDLTVKKILEDLKPSNDLCESILGLNDYLTSAIPNLTQASRSNMVELKKNHTMQWLNDLPSEKQSRVLDLAIKERPHIVQERKTEAEQRSRQRQQAMLEAKTRQDALKRKAQLERDELSEHHLITSSGELHQALLNIDAESISASKKKAKKLSLLKTQIKIRKKILGLNIQIVFSHARKQRPVNDIVKELSDHIAKHSSENSDCIKDPHSLVGCVIRHRFQTDVGQMKWYSGNVLGYNGTSKNHEIKYDGEEEHCNFDLTLDMLTGDLEIVN